MRSVYVFVLLTSIILVPFQPVFACGPDYLDPVFGFTKHAEYPLTDYSGGKLGLIPNTYGRISLFVFYRYLNDLPLSDVERKEVARAIQRRIGTDWTEEADDSDQEKESPLSRWMAAREKIVTVKKEPDQQKLLSNDYYYFGNCLDDSLDNATKTLGARIASGGQKSDLVSWVNGQDAVFSNCGEIGTMPEKVVANAPEWLKKDRSYQNAAAHFYRGEFVDARNAFLLISEDSASPWHILARYLVARTFIREASLSGTNDESAGNENVTAQKRKLLADAAASLNAIQSAPEMKQYHDSAYKLLALVKYRADPAARAVELAGQLSQKEANGNIYNDLTDYIMLMDQLESDAETRAETARNAEPQNTEEDYLDSGYQIRVKDVPADERAQDLTDWLITYQSADGFQHAFAKWKETKREHWLAAAISLATANVAEIDELMSAASKVIQTSPAYSTVSYYAIKLAIDRGEVETARKISDSVFETGFRDLPTATKNSFYAFRTRISQNLSEFLKYAKRTPTDYVWSFDFNEEGITQDEYEGVKKWRGLEMFGEDAVETLNTAAPLSVWLKAAGDDELPPHLKDFVVSAGWVRAFILKDKEAERAFAPLVAKYSKDFAPMFRNYERAVSEADKEAAALMFIAKYPVLETFIRSGWGRRDSEPTSIDSNRGNWWCIRNQTAEETKQPSFLSAAEYATGKSEYQKLRTLGEGATAYASRAVEFARNNPRHRNSPEILYLAVRASRYGCTDDNTGANSKAAFQLLHTRYRGSAWAKRTPFWYQ